MSSKLVIENLIAVVRKQISILAQYRVLSQEEIVGDDSRRGAVERFTYLMAQATINLAEALISYKKLRKPTTLSEAFYVLDESGLISKNLSERLVKMVGFRNIIAHDYVKINYDIVYDVLQNRLVNIEEFLRSVSKL